MWMPQSDVTKNGRWSSCRRRDCDCVAAVPIGGKGLQISLYMHSTKMVTPFHRKYAYTKKYVLYPNQLLHHLCMHTSLVCIVFSGRVMHTLVGRIMGIYGIWECQLVSSVWS